MNGRTKRPSRASLGSQRAGAHSPNGDKPTQLVIVTMRINCERCGAKEEESYTFDLPISDSDPKQEDLPGKCERCGAPITLRMSRIKALQ
jgi:ribosomal protein L44E